MVYFTIENTISKIITEPSSSTWDSLKKTQQHCKNQYFPEPPPNLYQRKVEYIFKKDLIFQILSLLAEFKYKNVWVIYFAGQPVLAFLSRK